MADWLQQAEARARARLALAGQRIARLFGQVHTEFDEHILHPLAGVLPTAASNPNVLNEAQRRYISEMSFDGLNDRNRRYEFKYTTADGRTGSMVVTIDSLLKIEPSYDTAKNKLVRQLAQLENDGFITFVRPTDGQQMHTRSLRPNALRSPHNPGDPPQDTRHVTATWADFPPFGGIGNSGITTSYGRAGTALGYTEPSSRVLPGLPLPKTWVRIYPTSKLFDRDQLGSELFVEMLEEMARQCSLLIRGANGNPEWHPAAIFFNNGIQFPGPRFPPDVSRSAYTYDGRASYVHDYFQYKRQHNFMRVSRGRDATTAGFIIEGKNDPFWLKSVDNRSRIWDWGFHNEVVSSDWGEIVCADAMANFMQIVNMASFLCGLGAEVHVTACAEYHRAMLSRAYIELGEPIGASLDEYVRDMDTDNQLRQERQRRGEAEMGATTLAIAGSSITQLTSSSTNATSGSSQRGITQGGSNMDSGEQATMQVLSAGMMITMAAFQANVYAGIVALVLTAIATLLTYLFTRPPVCAQQQVLLRDGQNPVNADSAGRDYAGCLNGDVYGGNMYPHSRYEAVSGRPAIRVVDKNGREL